MTEFKKLEAKPKKKGKYMKNRLFYENSIY